MHKSFLFTTCSFFGVLVHVICYIIIYKLANRSIKISLEASVVRLYTYLSKRSRNILPFNGTQPAPSVLQKASDFLTFRVGVKTSDFFHDNGKSQSNCDFSFFSFYLLLRSNHAGKCDRINSKTVASKLYEFLYLASSTIKDL